jgi:hypothetical protein
MSHRCLNIGFGLGAACLTLTLFCAARAGDSPAKPADDAAALAALIDRYIDEGLAAKGIKPVPLADDAEFLRRASLDLNGRTPRVKDVRDLIANESQEKRIDAVDRLLDLKNPNNKEAGPNPHYATHMANTWRAAMLPNNNNQQNQGLAPQMESWLRKRFKENTPYNQMARDLLTASVVANGGRPARPGRPADNDANAQAFYQANELKPENIAAATSRILLGVKIECAQCHDHPFAKWSRRQFWEYTAFFSGIGPQMPNQPVDDDGTPRPATDAAHRHDTKMPGSDKVIDAKFLDGKQPQWSDDKPTREVLADWIIADDNPFFARAAVNRVWAHFFGFGIIDPEDDLRDDNPASHPELLGALAKAFVEHHYDLKYLMKGIVLSKAYQRTSAAEGEAAEHDARLYSHMTVKGMTAEQLWDSIAQAVGYQTEERTNPDPNVVFNGNGGGARAEFIAKFANVADKRTETQTSILQALALMNGKFTADAASPTRGGYIIAALEFPGTDTRGKLDWVYMSILGRPMKPAEADKMIAYVEKGGPSADSKKALCDVFWVLLNSSEFMLNH